MGILDFIFPKRCINCREFGEYLCPSCFSFLSYDTKNICLVCGKYSFDGLTHPRCKARNTIEGSFTGIVLSPIAKKLIYQFKYKPYLSNLKSLMGDLLYESLIQNEEFERVIHENKKIILVPIPLSPKRFKKRGYNQAEVLAKELSKRLGFPVFDCLKRIKETKSQVGLNKKDRRENIKEAFILNTKYQIQNNNLILVDDVLTTGATMREACWVLKKAGAGRVWALAFAKED